MIRLGILGSTRGTNMLAIIEAIKEQVLDARIEVVISNKEQALILERARSFEIPTEYLNSKGLSRSEYDAKISSVLASYEVDLVVLIGYMRILSKEFVNTWHHRIINVHPSLLPAFAGMMDLEVHQAVLNSGVNETGCTVHYVTEQVDAGPAIVQAKCKVLKTDTINTLKDKVQKLEAPSLLEAIKIFTENIS
jgi:phosphoribosylglycinamide formyltransferase-1